MQDNRDRHRFRERYFIIIEFYTWIAISAVILIDPIMHVLIRGVPLIVVLPEYISVFIFAFFVLLFPIIFRLVFGSFPMESLRKWRNNKYTAELHKDGKYFDQTGSSIAQDITMAGLSSIEILALLAQTSQKLSVNIYTRAGVYLIVGVFVAFTGLAFFYSQTATASFSTNWLEALAILAPKLGILIFIETIAFFFLRQYRSAMDEFRYYESIKRNREETLALYIIASNGNKEIDVISLAKDLPFYSQTMALSKDQTTEIIETRKLEKNEIDLLVKVIDAVSINKK